MAALVAGFGDDWSRIAVVSGDVTLPWRTVWDAAGVVATSTSRTAGPIGVLGTTGVEFLTLMVAAAMSGRAVCALHDDWSEAELGSGLEAVGISEVFTPRTTLPAGVLAKRPPAIRESWTLGAERDFDEVGDAVFYIGFTSGSSGRPKPFARRHTSWTSSFDAAAELFGVSSEGEVVIPGSLQHSHFLFAAMLGWSQGAPLRLYERFDPAALADDSGDVRGGILYLVPTMITALEGAQVAPMDRVRSVVVSGAKMEPHHWDVAARLFPHAQVFELYGASETSFITVNQHGPIDEDPACVGIPFPGVEIDIRSRDDDEPGVGLVYVRSRFLFDGYLEAGTLVSGVPEDRFITVGDVGSIRPDGALSLRGRASNLVITGGKNVHPEEIEIALSRYPGIAECVVVGVPHTYWGEELVAWLVPAPGFMINEGDVTAFLCSRVAGYKVPKRWVVVEDLPRTPSGKTDRKRIRALASG